MAGFLLAALEQRALRVLALALEQFLVSERGWIDVRRRGGWFGGLGHLRGPYHNLCGPRRRFLSKIKRFVSPPTIAKWDAREFAKC